MSNWNHWNYWSRKPHALAAALSLSLVVGVAPAATVAPGALLITEVMANPVAVADSAGEWFEVLNTSNDAVGIGGLTLADDGANSHVVPTDAGLSILPGAYFVFGRNDDPLQNGGVPVGYGYGGFSLANGADAIRLLSGGLEVTQLRYQSGFVPAGASMERIALGPEPSNFRPSRQAYGLGDLGTPGSAGAFPGLQPVPLPPAVLLFGSALGAMFARRFGFRREPG